MILADEMMSMEQIVLLMGVVSAIVLFICIYGFVRFVRWGERDKKKNRDRDIELATIERHKPGGKQD